MNQSKHYLSFRVGQQWYGVDVDDIIEVLHFMALTELPGTPPDVLGLLTLRDEVMPVIDLRLRFGLEHAPLKLDTPLIAIHTPEGPLALVVDDADDVETVEPGQTTTAERTTSPYVKHVARLSEHLLLLLDAERIRAETDLDDAESIEQAAEPAD